MPGQQEMRGGAGCGWHTHFTMVKHHVLCKGFMCCHLRGPHALTVSSSPEPCSIPLPAEVQFRHLCPQGEKLPRQSHQTPSSLSKGAGRKEIPFPISGTHFPKQGHPTGPVHFPDGLIENLVWVTDLCASMSRFPLLSNGVVSGC